MSRDALRSVTLALQGLIHTAVEPSLATPVDQVVFIGPPVPGLVGNRPVSLFLFHIEPNRELRNTPREVAGASSDPEAQDALPLDVRFLISVFRQSSVTDPNELLRMGEIIAGLQQTPTIGPGLVPDQDVRLTPEPYPMEELSRIWGLFPNAPYVPSMVYLAAPVFVDARAFDRGAPVTSRRLDSGSSAETPDVFGSGLLQEADP